jgi:hypothetical protein
MLVCTVEYLLLESKSLKPGHIFGKDHSRRLTIMSTCAEEMKSRETPRHVWLFWISFGALVAVVSSFGNFHLVSADSVVSIGLGVCGKLGSLLRCASNFLAPPPQKNYGGGAALQWASALSFRSCFI